jgi:GTP diphosphokinase / guanosine-3',5'-bis(diphosphate) 3'-diphosphatase
MNAISTKIARQLQEELLNAIERNLGPDHVGIVRYACRLARRAHRGQKRDEGTPYIRHPLRVALTLATDLRAMASDPAFSQTDLRRDIMVIALLHDVLEDSPNAIRSEEWKKLGKLVHDAVRKLTRNKPQQKSDYLRSLRACPLHVRLVKLADRLDNLRSIHNSPERGKQEKILAETQHFILPLGTGTHSPLIANYIKRIRSLLHTYGNKQTN